MVACFVSYGCENIPTDLFEYCFHELLCEYRQCVVSGSSAKLQGLSSVVGAAVVAVAASLATLVGVRTW